MGTTMYINHIPKGDHTTQRRVPPAPLFGQAGSFGIPSGRHHGAWGRGVSQGTGWKTSQKTSSQSGSHSAFQWGPARSRQGSSLSFPVSTPAEGRRVWRRLRLSKPFTHRLVFTWSDIMLFKCKSLDILRQKTKISSFS